ncbi:MAG: DUF503 domain-containing protein [Candidatus Omnitrophota bacterium]
MILDLHIHETHSLKEKRHIVSSVKEKLKNKFNISIIESDYQDLWQKTQLAIAMAANSRSIAEKSFDQIETFILENYAIDPIAINKEYM